MATSSSESNNDIPSSPLGFHDGSSYVASSPSADSTADGEQNSSASSHDSFGPRQAKRGRYGLYNVDSSIPIPRETQRRWMINRVTSTVNNTQSQSGSSSQGALQGTSAFPPFEQSDCIGDSDTMSECESSTHSSELNLDCNSESDASSSAAEAQDAQVNEDNSSVCSSEDINYESSDSDCQKFLFHDSHKTTDEAVLELCNLFIKHRWIKSSLNDSLKFLAATLPKDNNMPRSLHMLYNYVDASSAPCSEKLYLYCSSCFQRKPDKSAMCEHCNIAQSGVFYGFSLADQIKYLFEHRKLADAMDDYREMRAREFDPQRNCLSDILDGTEYQRVKEHATGLYDLILMWNTDGVSLTHSYHVSLYPVLSMICEVAPRRRPYFTMVNLIWVDTKSPKMEIFLKPFVEELKVINQAGGVKWPKTRETHKSKVFAPLFIGDAPVRGDVLDIMRYHSIYGCEKCEQKAVKLPATIEGGKSKRRFVFQEVPATERSTERMQVQAAYAKSKNLKHVKGVKGKAVIEDIPHLNRASCTLAEYMHNILLGVTYHFTSKWFFEPGPWYIGNCRKTVDKFLESLKVLDFMRNSQKISLLKHFKASELRAWLLFYSLVALKETSIPDVYFQHWILLVKSIYSLLQDKISESEILSAEIMLRCFLRDVGKLYSNYDYVYNIHHLSHLTTHVREWGPLCYNSAFPFENHNEILSKMVHGTKHQAKELVESVKLAHCIQVLNVKVKNNIDNVSDLRPLTCGRANKYDLMNDDLEVLQSEGVTEFEMYSRASFKNVIYTSVHYDLKLKKCNSIIKFFHEGEQCTGKIICFLKTADDVLCYVERFKANHVNFIFHRESREKITHLSPVEESNVKILVQFSSIICKVLKVGEYIASPPNKVETHL